MAMPHTDPEARRAYHARYNRERAARDPEFRERMRKAQRSSRVAKAHAAQERVRRAVFAGKIVPSVECDFCANQGALHAAHIDYNRPLDVLWLCPVCHKQFDSNVDRNAGCEPAGVHNRNKSHCPQGHEYTSDNISWRRNGTSRVCKTCKRESEMRRRRR